MSLPSEAILVANQVTKQVPALDNPDSNNILDILNGVNLSVNTAESVAIVGASGSGKSTLLGLLAGLDSSTSGEIILSGQNLNNLDEDGRATLRSKYVGFVFQSFQLLPSLTALENVMLPLELKSDLNASNKSIEMLKRVGLTERLSHYPKQLSGGEQQRVAIARAFVTEPKIVFADEPTGNLDKVTGQQVIDLLFKINKESNTTLIIVTHDDMLADQCNRKVSLEQGVLSVD